MWVTTEPANSWRIVVIDPYGAPSFIAPQLIMWAGADMEGAGVAGLARCVSHGEGGDSCAGVWSARDGSALVSVPVRSDVTVALGDDWTIREARVTAYLREDARSNPFAAERDVAYFPDGGDRIIVSLADLEAGEWVIRVTGSGGKEGDSIRWLLRHPRDHRGLSPPGRGPTLCYNPPSVGL